MKLTRLAAALGLLAALLVPTVASAHPLGNFTVNHYSRIEPDGDRVRVIYVLDMAEIPTFQDKPRIDPNPAAYADQRAEELGQNLHLELNGQPAALRLEQRSLSFPDGAGGLPTLRLEAVYSARVSGDAGTAVGLAFRDDNDPTRIGWHEIVARPGGAGAQIQQSSVPASDVTDELRQYPSDLLSSPLNVREARLSFVIGAPAGAADAGVASAAGAGVARPSVPSTGLAVLDRANTAFADLANGGELTPLFILFAMGVAIVLGAAHALQPGHGKTIVAAYLVGSRGTAKHALFLGATVTATHTAGVYLLGIVTLFLSQYIVPERLYPILEVASGLLVVIIGVWLFGQRLLSAIGLRPAHGHAHGPEGHSHGPAESHAHPATHDLAEHSHAGQSHSTEQSHAAEQSHVAEHSHDEAHARSPQHSLALAHATVGAGSGEAAVAYRTALHGLVPDDRHTQAAGQSHAEHAHDGTQAAGHSHAHEGTLAAEHSHAHSPEGRRVQAAGSTDEQAGWHAHGGGKVHSHGVPSGERVSWKSLLALGVSGGLLPCPEALMVLLITIAAHRVLFGLLLIVAFSTGLAAVLVSFGLLLVYARGFFGRINLSSGLVPRLLPVASALVIVIAGGVITAQALPQIL